MLFTVLSGINFHKINTPIIEENFEEVMRIAVLATFILKGWRPFWYSAFALQTVHIENHFVGNLSVFRDSHYRIDDPIDIAVYVQNNFI